MQRSIFLGTQKHKISQGKRGSSSAPSVHPCTPASHLATHLPPKGLHKSVPQMTLLMPLAEIPLFYPWTCGGKAKREGERKYRQSRERCRGKKIISLFDQKNTSPFMYWQRWKAHGDRGSLAGRIKDPSVDDFTIWIFLETQNIFMAWETIWRYKQKAYSGDFMAALSQQWSTSEGNWEFEIGFFSRLSNSKREITLAAHGHQVIWCPGHSRWCRKLQALHGITEEYTSSPLEGKYRESDQGWLVPLRLFFSTQYLLI